MQRTPNLDLPYIMPSQAQKHVTHNEAIRALDAIVHAGVIDRDLTAPPGSPAAGAQYIVAATATGAWTGWENSIAAYQDGAWVRYQPNEGWAVWIYDEDAQVVWNGAEWVDPLTTISQLGIGTSLPGALLDVVSDGTQLNTLITHYDDTFAGTLTARKARGAKSTPTALTDGASIFSCGIRGHDGTAFTTSNNAALQFVADGNWSGSATGIKFSLQLTPSGSTSRSEVLGITGAGVATFANDVGIGSISPSAPLHVSNDNQAEAAFIDAYSSSSITRWRRANGTKASPTAVTNGQTIGKFGFGGYGATGFLSGSAAAVKVRATENWTDTNFGAEFVFQTKANSGGSLTTALTLTHDGDGEFANGVGIGGAQPDVTNKLSMNGAASLFNNAGNGHQIKINKAAVGDTASVLFQTGFSGRAEFGLAGNDDWAVKVSPDSSTWYTALVAVKDTGNVGIAGQASPATALDVNGPIKTGSTTVASLPAAGTVGAGTRSFVTDANATTFASVVAGGGSNNVPVYSDGTNWRIG